MKKNPIQPGVKITLDKERTLLLDINGMIAFEDETGISLMEGFDPSKMGLKQIRALLWACLLHEDPELTLQQVGAMLHMGNLSQIVQQINAAMSLSMPEPEEDTEACPLPESGSPSDG